MINSHRTEALQVLDDMGNLYPDMRLGQLIAFICTLAGHTEPKNLYDIEDEELISAALAHLQQRSPQMAG